MSSPDHSDLAPPGARDFRTTQWSVVLLARQEQAPQSRAALDGKCSQGFASGQA